MDPLFSHLEKNDKSGHTNTHNFPMENKKWLENTLMLKQNNFIFIKKISYSKIKINYQFIQLFR